METEALKYLREQVDKLPYVFKVVCLEVLSNDKFLLWPASPKKHQQFMGGLCLHTKEVVEISLAMAKTSPLQVDTNILLTAAIFHDYGKIRDYVISDVHLFDKCKNDLMEGRDVSHIQADRIWKYSSFCYKIRHVSHSYAEWIRFADYRGIIPELQEAIGHCILAHHGRPEYGSPVEPQTVEAFILHSADMLSARYSKTIVRDG